MTLIQIAAARPDSAEALPLLAELDTELQAQPYPAESRHAFSVEKLLRHGVAFFLATIEGRPVGCGGVKLFAAEGGDGSYGEVKRMYVRPDRRGQGVGKAILRHLAQFAKGQGGTVVRLETGIYQVEAIGLYEAFGFRRRGPFGEYREDPMSVYLELPLG